MIFLKINFPNFIPSPTDRLEVIFKYTKFNVWRCTDWF